MPVYRGVWSTVALFLLSSPSSFFPFFIALCSLASFFFLDGINQRDWKGRVANLWVSVGIYQEKGSAMVV